MGQGQSYQPARLSALSISSYDPARLNGDWWVVGVTPTMAHNIPNLVFDQGSDEYLNRFEWNPETKRSEFVAQGFKDGKPNPYTINYGQFWSYDSRCPGRMKVHHNGTVKLDDICVNWTNYDQFLVSSDFSLGAAFFLSRQRTLSPNDKCRLNSILASVGIDPRTIRWNSNSFDQSVKVSELKTD